MRNVYLWWELYASFRRCARASSLSLSLSLYVQPPSYIKRKRGRERGRVRGFWSIRKYMSPCMKKWGGWQGVGKRFPLTLKKGRQGEADQTLESQSLEERDRGGGWEEQGGGEEQGEGGERESKGCWQQNMDQVKWKENVHYTPHM